MKLFIQVKDGMTINHPALEENLIQAFERIPDDWEPFIRVEQPVPDIYEILEPGDPKYEKYGDTWMDVWPLRPMTPEEVQAKQQAVKDAWAARRQAENWADWIFDEAMCSYVSPIPRPAPVPGINIFWCGAQHNWREAPLKPDDGKQYQFDFLGWQWEEI